MRKIRKSFLIKVNSSTRKLCFDLKIRCDKYPWVADTPGTIPKKKKKFASIWQIPYPGKTAFPAPLITFSSPWQDSWQKRFHGEKVYFGSGMYPSWQRAWSMAGDVGIGARYMVPKEQNVKAANSPPQTAPDTQPWNISCCKLKNSSKS